MSPSKLSSVPIEITIEGVNIVLSKIPGIYCVAQKDISSLKTFQDYSIQEKKEEIKDFFQSKMPKIEVIT